MKRHIGLLKGLKFSSAAFLMITPVIILVLASMSTSSCAQAQSSNQPIQKGSVVQKSDPSEDLQHAVDFAVSLYCNQIQSSGMPTDKPWELKADVIKRLQKWGDDKGYTNFKATMGGVDSSMNGDDHVIQSGGNITIDLIGAAPLELKFTKGEIGIKDGEPFIASGTELSANGINYTFSGAWHKK